MQYQRINKNWKHGFEYETVKKARNMYYAMIAETDAMVGSMIRAADKPGIGYNTYFIFTSDHGEINMEHRQFYKMNIYESAVRVPLIVRGPGVTSGCAVREDIISLIDILTLLIYISGVKTPANRD